MMRAVRRGKDGDHLETGQYNGWPARTAAWWMRCNAQAAKPVAPGARRPLNNPFARERDSAFFIQSNGVETRPGSSLVLPPEER